MFFIWLDFRKTFQNGYLNENIHFKENSKNLNIKAQVYFCAGIYLNAQLKKK